MTALIVCAHGIGNHEKDFHEAWAEKIHEIPGAEDAEVVGLHWDDKLDQIEDRFPLVSQRFADALARFGVDELAELLAEEDYEYVREFLMDVLVYTALDDMRALLLAHCGVRLKELTLGRAKEAILVGHSLGSAMLAHVVEQEFRAMGRIPYHGAILTAPPLAIVSPIPDVIPDLLMVTPGMSEYSRTEAFNLLAEHWRLVREGSLRLVVNERDPIVSDVPVKVGGIERDLIPLQQGYTKRERRALERGHAGSFVSFAEGSQAPAKLVANHDVLRYLQHDAFKQQLTQMLEALP